MPIEANLYNRSRRRRIDPDDRSSNYIVGRGIRKPRRLLQSRNGKKRAIRSSVIRSRRRRRGSRSACSISRTIDCVHRRTHHRSLRGEVLLQPSSCLFRRFGYWRAPDTAPISDRGAREPRCRHSLWATPTGLMDVDERGQRGGAGRREHAIGRVLGAAAGVPHGQTSAILLPAVLAWNEAGCGRGQAAATIARGDRARG